MKRVFIFVLLPVAAFAIDSTKVINNGDNIAIIDKSGVRTVPFEQMTEAQRKESGMTVESVAKVRAKREADAELRKERVRREVEESKFQAFKNKFISLCVSCNVRIISDCETGSIVEMISGGGGVYQSPAFMTSTMRWEPAQVIFLQGLHGVDESKHSVVVLPAKDPYKYKSASGSARTIARAIVLPSDDILRQLWAKKQAEASPDTVSNKK